MTESILAIIAAALGLVLWYLKRRDTPEKKQERILRALEERIAKTRKVVASGDADAINRHAADLRDRIVRETGPDIYAGGSDTGDERP